MYFGYCTGIQYENITRNKCKIRVEGVRFLDYSAHFFFCRIFVIYLATVFMMYLRQITTPSALIILKGPWLLPAWRELSSTVLSILIVGQQNSETLKMSMSDSVFIMLRFRSFCFEELYSSCGILMKQRTNKHWNKANKHKPKNI